uniref:Uncharacterized protein n=1 Tax=Oryza rufipogon TaxID=4529 RepID=A0A0E0PRN9_ORYRU
MAVLLLVIVPVLMPLGWHAENIGHSDTTKGQGKGESACLSSQDDLQSSLGSSTSGRGGRQEALIFSDTCYSFHLKCRNPVHKSKSFDQDRRLDEPLNAMKKIA